MGWTYSGISSKQKTFVISAKTPEQLNELYQLLFNTLGIRATSLLHRGLCCNHGNSQNYNFSYVFSPKTRELAVGDSDGIPLSLSIEIPEKKVPGFYRSLLKLTSYEDPRPHDSPSSIRMSFVGEKTIDFYAEETKRAHQHTVLEFFTETEDLHERYQRAESGRFARFG